MASNQTNAVQAEAPALPAPPAGQLPARRPAKPAAKPGGFCVYLGPAIHGAIASGTVFGTGKEEALKGLGPILEKYPLVAGLIVAGLDLPESRLKVKTPGNLLYEKYNELAGQLANGQARRGL